MKYLDKIKSPADVKNLNEDDLPLLAQEIREVLVDTVSQNGGHLASNLGVVELTIALHRVFDCLLYTSWLRFCHPFRTM